MIEPSNPRKCFYLMYLNNWVKDVHFTLYTFKYIPKIVDKDAYFTSIDDKSGFDNVLLLIENSNSFFLFCINQPQSVDSFNLYHSLSSFGK